MSVIIVKEKLTASEIISKVKELPCKAELIVNLTNGFTVYVKRSGSGEEICVECTNHYLYERGIEVMLPMEEVESKLIHVIENAYSN